MGCEAAQEANSIYRSCGRLAPKQRLARCRKRGHEGSCLFCLHQRRRQEVSALCVRVCVRDLSNLARPAPSVWGEKLPFNTVCGEYSSSSGGWVHSVGFSPSGDVLAFASELPMISSLQSVPLT